MEIKKTIRQCQMVGKYLKFVIAFAFASAIGVQLYSNTKPKINAIAINTGQDELSDKSYYLALISDLHIKTSSNAINDLSDLWNDVISKRPDVILLAGDYIDNGGNNQAIA